MKIAIALIGNIRTWDKCKQSFIDTFISYNPDIFISTYDYQYNYHPYIANQIRFADNDEIILSKNDIINKFSNLNIREFDIENVDDLENKFNSEKINIDSSMIEFKSIFFQYRKIDRCMDMIKNYEQNNNIKYDFIIKTRFDVIYHIYNPLYNNNIISLSSGDIFPDDKIFVLDSNNMYKLAKFIYSQFYKSSFVSNNILPPHQLLLNSINHLNIKIDNSRIYIILLRK